MSVRRLVSGRLIPSLCVLVAAGCSSAPALAKEVHIYKTSFGSAGAGTKQFNAPGALAVNDATHDVYVVDGGNNRVQEFTAAGVFIAQFNGSGTFLNEGVTKAPAPLLKPGQIAIDNDPASPSYEDVYVVDRSHGVIDKFNPTGEYIGQITGASTPGGLFEPPGSEASSAIQGVAVDPAGTVWVTTQGGPIYSFTNAVENKYASERTTVFGGAEEGLGVDGEDNLYVRNSGVTFGKVSSAGEVLSSPFCGDTQASSAAVDPAGREVYLNSREAIEACSLSGEPIENFGAGHLTFSTGVAVDSSDGTVFASDEEDDDVAIFEGVLLPSLAVTAPVEQQPRSVTLTGTVNPEGKPVTSCVFEYATAEEFEASKTYAHSLPCAPGNLGSGGSPVAVSAHLEGLTPQTTYDYRLSAENLANIASSTANQELFTGPRLGGQFVTEVAASSVTLQDSVDPNGADTHYYIEYGPTGAYGSFAPLEPPGKDLGAADGMQSLRVHLQTLAASTSYHYRFIAVQSGEVFAEPDRLFTTQAVGVTAALPDGRAWELVSPVNKGGALFELDEHGGQVQAASDGSGITYVTRGPSVGEDPVGNSHQYSQVLSKRGPGGWRSVDLTLPGRLPENEEPAEVLLHAAFEYHLFSPDLSLAAVEPHPAGTPLLSPEATERTLYLRNNTTNKFLALVDPGDVPPETRIEEPGFNGVQATEWDMHFLAATPDLEHVVFDTPMALTPEAVQDETVQEDPSNVNHVQHNLYEWGAGQLGLVNILPNEEVAHGRPAQGVPLVRLAGMTDAAGLPRGNVQRAVSDDGRRIAWTWGEPYGPQLKSYRGLFVRDMVEGRTVRVGGLSAAYQTMNSEGSKIFYLESGGLHVFDFDAGTTTDLTGGAGAGVQELVSDVSEDGSYVYFVAKGVLAQGAVSGEDNLYLLRDSDEHWTTTFIATLSPEDNPDWYAEIFGAPFLANVTSRVSPDGRFLTFMSDRSLTGYDNIDAVSGRPDEEVYLYDAETGRLVCASCDPTGARPVGVFDGRESELQADTQGAWTSTQAAEGNPKFDHWLAGSTPGWDNLANDSATYQPRFLSDDGRLFFDSPVGLVPRDTNGLEDVYEYEPEGVGGCSNGTSSAMVVYVGELAGSPEGGCVGLISSGTSSSESVFYDASENGDDVFFDTKASLSGEDVDKAYDVYDAHVCSGAVPCRTVPVTPPPCSSGDSCKAAPSPQPEIFGAPPSATFNGAGNIAPSAVLHAKVARKALKKCPKAKRRVRGKCLARAKYKQRKPSDHRRAGS